MTTNAGAADMARSAFGFTRNKRVGEDLGGDPQAVHAGVPQPARRRSCRSVTCRTEVIVKVVDKFIMQLEAQLADRNVSIELTDEARRNWLVEHGYDETDGRAADGARDPVGRSRRRSRTRSCSAG